MNYRPISGGVLAALLLLCGAVSQAQEKTIRIGVTISATGPAASLGVPQKNTMELLPETLGGVKVSYIVLDDATDPTLATKNARRMIDVDKVDAIIGSSTTPTSLAVAQVAKESQVLQIGLAPYSTGENRWSFSVPQSYAVMYRALFEEMRKRKVHTIAFIGFSDAQGDAGLKEIDALAKEFDIKLVASERYARTDQSVTAQALRIIQAKPDAVVFAASSAGAALPMHALRQRGYKGAFYQNHGVANNDFLRVSGEAGEGMICPTGLVLVAEQLPEGTPSKRVALEYLNIYEGQYGAGTRNPFGAYAYDAYLLLDNAAKVALKNSAPGTPEFRVGLRDALEQTDKLALTHGVSSMSASNHSGLGDDAVVLITIDQGQWKLLK